MSKAIGATLQTALDSNSTTLGWAVLITRPDTTQIPLSTVGREVELNGVTYPERNGFIPSDPFITLHGDATPAMTQIQLPAGTIITAADVTQRLFDNSTVNIYLFDWSSLEYVEIGFAWYIGGADINDAGQVTFKIYCDTARARRLFLDQYGVGCKHDLGDSRCGVNVAGSYTDTATVLAYVSSNSFTLTGASTSRESDYYNYGAVKFTSGNNQGFSYTVRNWDADTATIELMEPLRGVVEAGDTFQIHAGCDWRRSTCRTKFNNLLNYGGFDFLPDDRANFEYPQPVSSVVNNYYNDSVVSQPEDKGVWKKGSKVVVGLQPLGSVNPVTNRS